MFSLHIDTARTWRGGQNQVLVTVMGLRALGHRTLLVAHPRRAAPAREGGARPAAAGAADRDGPERRVAAVAGHQAAQAGHRPCARPARRRDGRAGAVDEHAAGRSRRSSPPAESTSTCAATRSRAGSTARSTASSARRTRSGRCSSATAFRPTRAVTVHEGIDLERVDAAPAGRACTRSSGCPTTRRSSATSPRWCRTRASGT